MYSCAAHDGHRLAEREEVGVEAVGEADVVRRQRPPHQLLARQLPHAQDAPGGFSETQWLTSRGARDALFLIA